MEWEKLLSLKRHGDEFKRKTENDAGMAMLGHGKKVDCKDWHEKLGH